jgi:hypothetical protein
MNRRVLLSACLAVAASYACLAPAHANSIAVSSSWRRTSAQESGDAASPAPLGGWVIQLRMTTDSDILAIENVSITTAPPALPLYNNPFGDAANANRPQPALFPVFPALEADSYFDTPGNTSRLGADLPGDGVTTFGDLDNNGPQTDFVFAQLTYPATLLQGTATFRVSINSTTNPGTPYSQDFSVRLIPEPTSAALAALAAASATALRRRQRDGSRVG